MHIPVLLEETLRELHLKNGGVYADCTVNRAGHSKEIAKAIGKSGTLVIFDLDNEALEEASKILEAIPDHPKIIPVNANFRTLKEALLAHKLTKLDGVLADLGLSSEELDVSGRGFSFRFDEPLLMTFSSTPTDEVLTAKDVVNDWSEESLADIFFGYADERYARRIARAIVEARSHHTIATTYQLVDVIASAVPAAYRHSKTHFATKVFQALRMAVNDELGSVQELINSLPEVLTRDGRACFITFHSTEDRIVKQAIRENLSLSLVYKKAIMPTPLECSHNPRARSAQLRVAHLKSIHE